MHSFLYIALGALVLITLSAITIGRRRKHQTALGDGEAVELRQAIRAQGNCAEYLPMGLLMLALLDSSGVAPWLIHAFGIFLLMGRVLHALSLLKVERYKKGKLVTHAKFRVRGMQLTFGTMGAMGALLLLQWFRLVVGDW